MKMSTIILSGLGVVALSLVLSGLLVIPAVLLIERVGAWVRKARARKTALNRLRMLAIL